MPGEVPYEDYDYERSFKRETESREDTVSGFLSKKIYETLRNEGIPQSRWPSRECIHSKAKDFLDLEKVTTWTKNYVDLMRDDPRKKPQDSKSRAIVLDG
jgi:hypothetical protein